MQSELQGLKRQLEHVALQREHYRGLAQAAGAAYSMNHSAAAISQPPSQMAGNGSMVAGQTTAVSQAQHSVTARRRVSFETWTGDVANMDAGRGPVGGGDHGGAPVADTPMRDAAAFAIGSGVGGWVPSGSGGKGRPAYGERRDANAHPYGGGFGAEAAPGNEFRPPPIDARGSAPDSARVSAVSSVGAGGERGYGGAPGPIAMESPSPWTTPATRGAQR